MAEGTQDIQGLREVLASEILAKIEKGEPVDYYHIIIKGDLIIKTLDLPKDKDNFFVSSSIRIDNSSFDGIADFSNLIIIKPIRFYITSFFKGATFNDSKFMCFADFRGTRFCGGSAFMNTHFCGSLFFDDVNFLHQATFWDARFDCDVNFNRGVFQDEASLIHSIFRSTSYFIDAIFNHGNFQGSIFGDDANFGWASFNIAEFNRVKFEGHANFKDVTFSGWAKFTDSIFNGYSATFRDAIFFRKEDQEYICRKAKNLLEKNGDREEAGYHFYREMEAKRRQKPWYIRYPELIFIQMIFGYGVHPFRL